MGIRSQRIEQHWNYFLAIERDVDVLSRYVEFHKDNFDCFSIEIARILLVSAAEVDVVCKQICQGVDANSSAQTINNYRDELSPVYQDIPQFKILLPRFGLTLTPWDEWSKANGVPVWWTAYNKTKHNRNSNYEEANLKNALNAVAGLFVAVLYLYRAKAEAGELLPSPQLFRADNEHIGAITHSGFEFGINYILPGPT
jgi:hypothetical protein